MQSTKTKKKNNIYLSLLSKVSFAVFILVDSSKPEIVLDLHGRLDELIQQFHLLRLVCKQHKAQFFHHVMAHLNFKEKRSKISNQAKIYKKLQNVKTCAIFNRFCPLKQNFPPFSPFSSSLITLIGKMGKSLEIKPTAPTWSSLFIIATVPSVEPYISTT